MEIEFIISLKETPALNKAIDQLNESFTTPSFLSDEPPFITSEKPYQDAIARLLIRFLEDGAEVIYAETSRG